MRPADAHVNPQEFELLLFGAVDSTDSNASGTLVPEAQQHLSGCAVCQSVAERYRNADDVLSSLEYRKASRDKNSGTPPVRRSNCPDEESWLYLAAGLMKEDEAVRQVTHAATCDWCGQLLKESVEDLAQDVTPEEQRILAALPSASSAWQREMGKKLATAARRSHTAALSVSPARRFGKEPAGDKIATTACKGKEKSAIFSRPRLVWASVSLALAVAAFWITWLKTREPDVDQLLAQAYTEQRTIELRIPGAKHSLPGIERGPGRSHLKRPTSLLDAELLISQGLNKSPEDQGWLNKRGRVELLEGDYKSAILTLQHAKDLSNADPRILTDLATAYFERAEAEAHPTDYDTAAALLDTVLQRNPEDGIALFNRAIVHERLFQYSEAIKDWEQYLPLSHDEAWNGEALQHVQQLKEKMK